MIDYQLGQEYLFEVISSMAPSQKARRKTMTTKSPILYYVKDEENTKFKIYHRGKMKKGRIIKCMVNGFNPGNTPQLVLSLSEQPHSEHPGQDETVSSARLLFTPMGNKR